MGAICRVGRVVWIAAVVLACAAAPRAWADDPQFETLQAKLTAKPTVKVFMKYHGMFNTEPLTCPAGQLDWDRTGGNTTLVPKDHFPAFTLGISATLDVSVGD